MRLFGSKGNGGGQPGGGFWMRGGTRSARFHHGHDLDTIGSAIETKDQFDIVIPLPKNQTLQQWRFVERSDTMVSSITTEDVHKHPSGTNSHGNGSNHSPVSSKSASSWCCCSSGGTAEETEHTENTLLAPTTARGYTDAAVMVEQGHRVGGPTGPETTNGEVEQNNGFWPWCTPSADALAVDATAPCKGPGADGGVGGIGVTTGVGSATAAVAAAAGCGPTRPSKDLIAAELNRNNSLFDHLSDDEDGPEGPDGPNSSGAIKRVRQKVRKAFPVFRRTRSGSNLRALGVTGVDIPPVNVIAAPAVVGATGAVRNKTTPADADVPVVRKGHGRSNSLSAAVGRHGSACRNNIRRQNSGSGLKRRSSSRSRGRASSRPPVHLQPEPQEQ